ncbi:uncharacterized protein LOC134533139 [Bacillus rossius redtenbacheri]|uniref:uncharacterized protein LOC134533139 n=1 Tax=Bacillus rossius redtenbacheri TaxID=93214 RepID=UPI002FDD003B
MEQRDAEGTCRRKEWRASGGSSGSCADLDFRSPEDEGGGLERDKTYPFALVLRLRVLQIVLGISTLVMGTVSIIEERGQVNLGLGLPAGGLTVLAAAASIHTSRGFGGYQPPGAVLAAARCPGMPLRAAGPPLALWAAASLVHVALLVQAVRTLALPAAHDLLVLASVELALTLAVAATAAAALLVDCRYDPD